MAFDNTGFENEDATALGYPEDWTVAFVSTAFLQAAYDDGSAAEAGLRPGEAFEGGWDSNESFTFAYEVPLNPSEIIGAIYDFALTAEGVEDFEEGWNSNESFLFSWSSAEEATYDSGTPELGEDFEEEWNSNESFSFSMGSTTAALYDTANENREDFEEEWNSNESFDFTMGSITAASYDSGGTPEAFEDFEEVSGPVNFTVNTGTDRVLINSHGLSNNQKVTVSNLGGELPSGLNENYEYFIINVTANDFQLATSSGGSAIDLTTTGVGTHTLTPDPTVFWVKLMETL